MHIDGTMEEIDAVGKSARLALAAGGLTPQEQQECIDAVVDGMFAKWTASSAENRVGHF